MEKMSTGCNFTYALPNQAKKTQVIRSNVPTIIPTICLCLENNVLSVYYKETASEEWTKQVLRDQWRQPSGLCESFAAVYQPLTNLIHVFCRVICPADQEINIMSFTLSYSETTNSFEALNLCGYATPLIDLNVLSDIGELLSVDVTIPSLAGAQVYDYIFILKFASKADDGVYCCIAKKHQNSKEMLMIKQTGQETFTFNQCELAVYPGTDIDTIAWNAHVISYRDAYTVNVPAYGEVIDKALNNTVFDVNYFGGRFPSLENTDSGFGIINFKSFFSWGSGIVDRPLMQVIALDSYNNIYWLEQTSGILMAQSTCSKDMFANSTWRKLAFVCDGTILDIKVIVKKDRWYLFLYVNDREDITKRYIYYSVCYLGLSWSELELLSINDLPVSASSFSVSYKDDYNILLAYSDASNANNSTTKVLEYSEKQKVWQNLGEI